MKTIHNIKHHFLSLVVAITMSFTMLMPQVAQADDFNNTVAIGMATNQMLNSGNSNSVNHNNGNGNGNNNNNDENVRMTEFFLFVVGFMGLIMLGIIWIVLYTAYDDRKRKN